jgi:phosphodiesterase/alkaline phosphatase D-like protein
MGAAQERWLYDGLAASDTRWNLIAHQVMVMNLDQRKSPAPGAAAGGTPTYSMDQWPGYMANRRRLLDCIDTHCKGNVVNVTGDAHRHYAGDLLQDEGAPGAEGKVISSEFLATSIASGADGKGDDDAYSRQVRADNPFLKATTDQRGYLLCDIIRKEWTGDLKVVDKVTKPGGKLDLCPLHHRERPPRPQSRLGGRIMRTSHVPSLRVTVTSSGRARASGRSLLQGGWLKGCRPRRRPAPATARHCLSHGH